jgi:phosphatidylserine decarboxylase
VDMPAVAASLLSFALVAATAYVFWRRVWFFRNPPRVAPPGEGLVAAADGTVVYVKKLSAAEDVIHIKRGLAATLGDVVREDVALPKLLIGVFMSPFDVHYNRAPMSGKIEFVRHYPGHGPNVHMGRMHWRVLLRRRPYYEGSTHVVRTERTVTKINGSLKESALSCYIVQIAAKTVSGIESFVSPGVAVDRGAIFGMIRIGSQVDVVVPWREGMQVHVQAGDRVRAGETVIVS